MSDSKFVTFVVEGRELRMPRSLLVAGSPFLRARLEADPACAVLALRNARYAAVDAALDACAYGDDAKFEALVSRAAATNSGAAASAEMPSAIQELLISLFETCARFAMPHHAGAAARAYAGLALGEEAALAGVRSCRHLLAARPLDARCEAHAAALHNHCLRALPAASQNSRARRLRESIVSRYGPLQPLPEAPPPPAPEPAHGVTAAAALAELAALIDAARAEGRRREALGRDRAAAAARRREAELAGRVEAERAALRELAERLRLAEAGAGVQRRAEPTPPPAHAASAAAERAVDFYVAALRGADGDLQRLLAELRSECVSAAAAAQRLSAFRAEREDAARRAAAAEEARREEHDGMRRRLDELGDLLAATRNLSVAAI